MARRGGNRAGQAGRGKKLRRALQPKRLVAKLTPTGSIPSAPPPPPQVKPLTDFFVGLFSAFGQSNPYAPWDCPRCGAHVERSNSCLKCFTRNPAGVELSYPNARRLCFRPRGEYTRAEVQAVVREYARLGWECTQCDAASFCETLTVRDQDETPMCLLPAHGEPPGSKR